MCQARFKCFPYADSVLTPSLWPGYPPPPTAQMWTLRHKDTGGPAPGRCAADRPAPHTLASEPRFTITTRRWSPRPRLTVRGGEVSRSEHGLCIRNAHKSGSNDCRYCLPNHFPFHVGLSACMSQGVHPLLASPRWGWPECSEVRVTEPESPFPALLRLCQNGTARTTLLLSPRPWLYKHLDTSPAHLQGALLASTPFPGTGLTGCCSWGLAAEGRALGGSGATLGRNHLLPARNSRELYS